MKRSISFRINDNTYRHLTELVQIYRAQSDFEVNMTDVLTKAINDLYKAETAKAGKEKKNK